MLRLMSEQPTLSLKAAAVTAEAAIGSNNAMAGDDDGNRIRAIRRADRSHRRGRTYGLGHFRVRGGPADPDAA